MPRNAEVIRQWTLLRAIEAARLGLTVGQMAEDTGVTTRTIYRDLEALQEVGFPLSNESRDNHTYWILLDAPFKHLMQLGFSLSELCALYLSRRLVEVLTGIPFQAALQGAFTKFEQEIPAKMRAYLDRLPSVMSALPSGGKVKRSPKHEELVDRLMDATLDRRVVEMRYHTLSHDCVRDYLVYPIRLVYMHGGLYLRAWVPAYSQLRTFATQRIHKLSVRDERFEPSEEWAAEPFAASLGPHDGPAQHVVLRFGSRIARQVRERTYHPTQRTETAPDGSLRMELDVCDDPWLRSWILSFGRAVQVVEPQALAQAIIEEFEQARRHYDAGIGFEAQAVSPALMELSLQTRLPF